jgi:hypothetical protein
MDAHEELVWRCANHRREKIGPLSDEAFAELVLAVRADPASFVDTTSDEAFLMLARALGAYHENMHDDDLLDDDQYLVARNKRLAGLQAACERCAEVDETCVDARLVGVLARDLGPDALLDELLKLEAAAYPQGRPAASGDLWDNVSLRPWLRLRAAISRTCLDAARCKMALGYAESVMNANPTDQLGARFTSAIAYARLEDEQGFDQLDARFSRHGNAWSNLARVVLLYKLGRMPAARRALHGYDELSEGAAYALLRPTFVELYLPDRPAFKAGGFQESLMAAREAEPTIADTPDLVRWAQDQEWFYASAQSYAEGHDLDW